MSLERVKKANRWVCLFLFVLVFVSCNQPQEEKVEYRSKDEINLIPKPRTQHVQGGFVRIDAQTTIYTVNGLESEARYLKGLLEKSSDFTIGIKSIDQSEFTRLIVDSTISAIFLIDTKATINEYFQLITERNVITIFGADGASVMRGIQTLRQLFVPAFLKEEKRSVWYLPEVYISDSPRFQHRGMLLDVCRHFFDKEVVKKYIDLLAFYKMNVLHLHLTEDQGWRIESEKYPKLNEISSWRTEANGSRYGGFYTKAELKEIVAYAAERHITVIPEIELPGHSQAALAAYPQFSCVGKEGTIEVANDWGVFKEIYCAGNDSTFVFIEDILTEVMEIFPSEYIHIGGDEAPKFRWEHCAKCQKRMSDEGLHDEHELQSYFIRRVEKFLNDHDRKLIGWDEILEGGLSPNATVQSWRGMEGGIAAANAGHEVIMSPTSHCYLDYGLDKIDMEKIYSFDPIPKELAKDKHKFIIGGECNMWTEHVPNEKTLDSRVSPRMQAFAEAMWTAPDQHDYKHFYQRMQAHYPLLKAMGVEYGAEAIPASLDVSFSDGEVSVSATQNIPDIELHKAWNGSSQEKWSDFIVTESGRLVVQATKKGENYGDPITQDFAYHKALAKPVHYSSEYNNWYTAGGDSALVDGKLGSLNFRDGNWQGFYGNDAEMTVDLGTEQPITKVQAAFYQYNNAWIFAPKSFTVHTSTDGKTWTAYGSVQPEIDPKERGQHIALLKIEKKATARYVKVQIENIGAVPDWHEAARSKAWIFVDEIVIL